jgi:hypothetical protein
MCSIFITGILKEGKEGTLIQDMVEGNVRIEAEIKVMCVQPKEYQEY